MLEQQPLDRVEALEEDSLPEPDHETSGVKAKHKNKDQVEHRVMSHPIRAPCTDRTSGYHLPLDARADNTKRAPFGSLPRAGIPYGALFPSVATAASQELPLAAGLLFPWETQIVERFVPIMVDAQ